MASYGYYPAYPATASPYYPPTLPPMSSSSLATALDDPLWSTPRHAQLFAPGVTPMSLATAGTPLPPSYISGSVALPHAPSPDSTSSLDYASESSLDAPLTRYDGTISAPTLAYGTMDVPPTVDSHHNPTPIAYYAADGTVSGHDYETGTGAVVRVTPSKRMVQIPDVDVEAIGGYLPSPASSYGGGCVRARRPAPVAVKMLPVSQGDMGNYPTGPAISVKVESPRQSAVFPTGYDGYHQYISLEANTVGSSPPQQGNVVSEPQRCDRPPLYTRSHFATLLPATGT